MASGVFPGWAASVSGRGVDVTRDHIHSEYPPFGVVIILEHASPVVICAHV